MPLQYGTSVDYLKLIQTLIRAVWLTVQAMKLRSIAAEIVHCPSLITEHKPRESPCCTTFLEQHQGRMQSSTTRRGLFGLISRHMKPTIRPVTKKILIAENELRIAEALTRRLKSRGYVPMVVSDLAPALQSFEDERPDLVVISLTLDDEIGPELCKQMRARPLGALVPILLLGTGDETIATVPQAIAIGADHYFRKPSALGELLAKVVTYIGPGTGLDLNDLGDKSRNDDELSGDSASDWAELGGFLKSDEPESQAPVAMADDALLTTDEDANREHAAASQFGLPPLVSMAEPPGGFAEVQYNGRLVSGRFCRDISGHHASSVAPVHIQNSGRLKVGHPVPMVERGFEVVLFEASTSRLTGRIEVASSGILRRVFWKKVGSFTSIAVQLAKTWPPTWLLKGM